MAAGLASLALAGCSHGTVTELPAAPSAPPVLLRVLTITPVGGATMLMGASAPITSEGQLAPNVVGAYAQYSDGSAQYAKATWTSSDPGVVAVDGDSIVAKGRGTATLTATVAGMKAAETFTVEPGVDGSWSGTYVVDNCQAGSGSVFEMICGAGGPGRPAGVLPIGTAAPVSFQITRGAGADLTATAAFGELRGTLTGVDRGQNFLALTGELTSVNGTTLTITYWSARARTDLMEGFVNFEVRVKGFPSLAVVNAHFADVMRR